MERGSAFIALIIVGLMLLVARIMPSSKTAAPRPVRVRRPTAAELEAARKKARRSKLLRLLGMTLVAAGLIVLAAGFHLFDYLLTWYAFAGIIILAGLVILLISARRSAVIRSRREDN
jgi:hypothetical protein